MCFVVCRIGDQHAVDSTAKRTDIQCLVSLGTKGFLNGKTPTVRDPVPPVFPEVILYQQAGFVVCRIRVKTDLLRIGEVQGVGDLLEFYLVFFVFYLDFIWILSGFYLDYIWILSGFYLEFIWILSRFVLILY